MATDNFYRLDLGVAGPHRVRLSRAKGYRMPPNTKKVDRSTRWGNPFNATQVCVAFYMATSTDAEGFGHVPLIPLHQPPSLERCLDHYVAYLRARLDVDPRFLKPLRGFNLGCWCPLDSLCHADVLLRLANT